MVHDFFTRGKRLPLHMATCSHCGGPVWLIAAIEEPAVIAKILAHLGLPTKAPPQAPGHRPTLLFRRPEPTRDSILFASLRFHPGPALPLALYPPTLLSFLGISGAQEVRKGRKGHSRSLRPS